MLYNLYTLIAPAVLFSAPSLHGFFTERLFTLVSLIFSVPQAKTFVMNGKTVGQFRTTAIALSIYTFAFFVHGASCMPPLEADVQRCVLR